MNVTELPIIGGIKELSPLEAELLDQPQPETSLLGKVANAYYSPKCFEQHGRLYERLGIRYFKEKLMQLRRKVPYSSVGVQYGNNYFIGQEDRNVVSLQKFESETRYNEFVHALVQGGLVAHMGLSLIADSPDTLVVSLPLFIVNGYILMTQRWNRNRVYNTLDVLREQYHQTITKGVA
ncbi:MAG: hypothetical protein WCV90_06600 [Candidatus Woesearchaeota archaeon]